MWIARAPSGRWQLLGVASPRSQMNDHQRKVAKPIAAAAVEMELGAAESCEV